MSSPQQPTVCKALLKIRSAFSSGFLSRMRVSCIACHDVNGRSVILEQQIQTQSAVVQFISNTSQHRTNLPGRTAVIIGLASVCWPVLIAGVVCLGGSVTWLNPLEAFSTAAVAAKDTWKSHDALWYVKPGWIAMKCLSERKKKKYASWDHFNILRLRSQTC